MQLTNKIEKEEHINESGFNTDWTKYIATIEPNQYIIDKELAESLGGDQPKTFIKLNEHGTTGKSDPENWTDYIAKFPRKWYPNEAITEHLLTCIGEAMGMQMATSKLAIINGQVRFLSRYFLKPIERLTHGAEIYTNYLDDIETIKLIDKHKLESKLLPYEFTVNAINQNFSNDANSILKAYHKMLIFDAIIGVNDRHFHNWGVIENTRQNKVPKFSPLYDTSRALLWNIPESKIDKVCVNEKMQNDWLNIYIEKSMSKITFYGEDKLNHFNFLELLLKKKPHLLHVCSNFIKTNVLEEILTLIEKDFKNLFSLHRLTLIKLLLRKRFETISRLINTIQ